MFFLLLFLQIRFYLDLEHTKFCIKCQHVCVTNVRIHLSTSLTFLLSQPSLDLTLPSPKVLAHRKVQPLHCTTLHSTVLHCTTLHFTKLQCTALQCTTLHGTALHCNALHCTTVQCYVGISAVEQALQCTTLYCTVLQCNAVQVR